MTRLEWMILALLATMAAGAGYWLAGTDDPRPEVITAEPQRTQVDGSVIPARQPSARPPKAPHKLPKGSAEERRITAVVQPTREDCPPVQVDLSLIREGDGRRVVVSSPDGKIVSALDVPIEAALMPPPSRPWAAGLSYDPIQRRSGAWIERDIARLRVGAEVMQGEKGDFSAMVRVGWRW